MKNIFFKLHHSLCSSSRLLDDFLLIYYGFGGYLTFFLNPCRNPSMFLFLHSLKSLSFFRLFSNSYLIRFHFWLLMSFPPKKYSRTFFLKAVVGKIVCAPGDLEIFVQWRRKNRQCIIILCCHENSVRSLERSRELDFRFSPWYGCTSLAAAAAR